MCRAGPLTWQWDSEQSRRFQARGESEERGRVSPSQGYGIPWIGGIVPHKPSVIEIDCDQVRKELSEYLDGYLTSQSRLQIEQHLQTCDHYTAVYDGMRNVVRLLGDER